MDTNPTGQATVEETAEQQLARMEAELTPPTPVKADAPTEPTGQRTPVSDPPPTPDKVVTDPDPSNNQTHKRPQTRKWKPRKRRPKRKARNWTPTTRVFPNAMPQESSSSGTRSPLPSRQSVHRGRGEEVPRVVEADAEPLRARHHQATCPVGQNQDGGSRS